MSDLAWGAAWAAVFAGAVVQGSIGFGVAVVAAPVLALLDPVFVPGPMLALGTILAASMALRERAALDVRGMFWALVGRVPGTVAGALVVRVLSDAWITVILAAVVLFGVATSAVRPIFKPTGRTLFGAGAVSGLMGTASSIGGPPIALVYQESTGAQLRSTLAAYFAVGAAMSVAGLAAVGEYGVREGRATAGLVVPLLLGFAVSRHVASIVDRGHTRLAVLGLSALSAVALVATLVF